MRPVILDALFWVAVSGCAVAQFFILRAVLRPMAVPFADSAPSSTGADLPVRRQSGRTQEIVWALLPSLLLAAAFVLAWRVMHPAAPAAPVLPI
jgi:heme/copper-type cytochrome/quinol oxidase subunit 2